MVSATFFSLLLLGSSPATVTEPRVPELPAEPVLTEAQYPKCRSDWIKEADNFAQFEKAQQCYETIARFQQFDLTEFIKSVATYLSNIDYIESNLEISKNSDKIRKSLAERIRIARSHFLFSDAKNASDGYIIYWKLRMQSNQDLEDLSEDMRKIKYKMAT